MTYIEENNLITQNQHGFLPKRSCLSNLICTIDGLTSLYDERKPVDELFLDLQKAFDSVPHQRLIYKLEKLGINGKLLCWIESFLTHRFQRVAVGGKYSSWSRVKSGVPQGSVLGPILFLLYINDISNLITTNIKIFADDSKIFGSACNIDEADCIQKDLDALDNWCKVWMLKFNPSKCHVLHIGKNNHKYLYHIGGFLLSSVDDEKDLGIIMSNDLKQYKDVTNKVKKANKMLGMIKRTFSYLDKEILLRLYKAYVRPILEYCQQAMSPYLQKDINEIEKVQRRATKLLHYLKDKSYEERLKDLDLHTLEYRRTRGDMIVMYKITNGLMDVDASLLFKWKQYSGLRGHSKKVEHTKSNTEIRRNFFTKRVITPWNKLPDYLIKADSVNAFKKGYDQLMATENRKTEQKITDMSIVHIYKHITYI